MTGYPFRHLKAHDWKQVYFTPGTSFFFVKPYNHPDFATAVRRDHDREVTHYGIQYVGGEYRVWCVMLLVYKHGSYLVHAMSSGWSKPTLTELVDFIQTGLD